jgi:hypothetical protein
MLTIIKKFMGSSNLPSLNKMYLKSPLNTPKDAFLKVKIEFLAFVKT